MYLARLMANEANFLVDGSRSGQERPKQARTPPRPEGPVRWVCAVNREADFRVCGLCKLGENAGRVPGVGSERATAWREEERKWLATANWRNKAK